MTYEPKIIAFLCTWCSYTGADTAGIARLKSPANLRAVRVPCSGRVSPELVMRAFDQGADGVLILGCHIGECHYDSGNHRAAKRIPILRALLDFAGLEAERLRLDWVSASEGERFARITQEFVETVRALGPARWRGAQRQSPEQNLPFAAARNAPTRELPSSAEKTAALRAAAQRLLAEGAARCVIAYAGGPRHNARPIFARDAAQAGQLVWNNACKQNLSVYLQDTLEQEDGPVAVVVRPCDSRAINMLIAEKKIARERVHVIGVECDQQGGACDSCAERTPRVYDELIDAPSAAPPNPARPPSPPAGQSPAQRLEFWLAQFDRCLRCYACRQACPMCDCPTCLYERDDSLWVGMGIGLDEKRTFHLGRAFHLAGRCVGCNACEAACPVDIPIRMLNEKLAQEIHAAFGFRAGQEAAPSPFVTVLGGEEARP